MAILLSGDGQILDNWPHTCSPVSTSAPLALIRRLLDPSATERVLAAGELSAGQIVRLFERPGRWHNARRAGRRLRAWGLVAEARALKLGEGELVRCCAARDAAGFLRRVMGEQGPPRRRPSAADEPSGPGSVERIEPTHGAV